MTDDRPCPLCHGRRVRVIDRVAGIPVHSTVLLDDPEAALAFPRGDMALAACSDCGFLFNAAFDERLVDYAGRFEESQHYSPTFSRFAEGLIADLDRRIGLAGCHVVEIGCGRGDFLVELCRRTGCRGTGIDPGFRAERLPSAEGLPVRFLAEPFSASHGALAPDIVLCRHTLEHIAAVDALAGAVAAACAGRGDAVLVLETPDVGRVLREVAFWDVYYEHCSYFTPATHAALFRRHGFRIAHQERVFDDQYLLLTADRAAGPEGADGAETDVERHTWTDRYERGADQHRRRWRERIAGSASAGRRWLLWGGSSKAVSFLTSLGLRDEVLAVVDINPHRQGRFLPGSGHPIVAPEAVRDLAPDEILVMNPVYLPEIAETLRRLGVDATLSALTGMPDA